MSLNTILKEVGECGEVVEFEVFLPNGWHKTFSVLCGEYGDGKLRKCAKHLALANKDTIS